MSDNHDHPQEQSSQEPVPVVAPRTASPAMHIQMLKQRIAEKMEYISRLEDTEVNLAAICADLQNENTALTAILDQIRAENQTLRERLGIDALGAIEPEGVIEEATAVETSADEK